MLGWDEMWSDSWLLLWRRGSHEEEEEGFPVLQMFLHTAVSLAVAVALFSGPLHTAVSLAWCVVNAWVENSNALIYFHPYSETCKEAALLCLHSDRCHHHRTEAPRHICMSCNCWLVEHCYRRLTKPSCIWIFRYDISPLTLNAFLSRCSTPTPTRTTTAVTRRWILWPPPQSTSWRRGWRNWSSSLWSWRKVGKKSKSIVMWRWILWVIPSGQIHPHMGCQVFCFFLIKGVMFLLFIFVSSFCVSVFQDFFISFPPVTI